MFILHIFYFEQDLIQDDKLKTEKIFARDMKPNKMIML